MCNTPAIQIIKLNKHYLIANKCAGILCQPTLSSNTTKKKEKVLLNILKEQLAHNKSGLAAHLKNIHRIDKVVTGGVLFATNKNSAQMFSRYLRKGGNCGFKLKRRYLAILQSPIFIKNDPEQGIISFKNKSTGSSASPMITHYKKISKNLYAFELCTGQKHQIRVTCKTKLRSPILNDIKYGAKPIKNFNDEIIALHSAMMRITIGRNEPESTLIPMPKSEYYPLWEPFLNTTTGYFHEYINKVLLDDSWGTVLFE
ncbi:related to 21S rRNA pseudouridine(2819) synthase [Saccharomycodes ludwigii]|uniref:21S rRNA pseudouridine(2819) synthase n=1 Tax=Saccharomycodes ludwigii TaxID=36035 RepID=A0A376B8C8_9ASCO|nr:hypothetical protein SCDLUD_001852 [Saccharomycodes ludwigii]KAH3902041.1 hypothetical protein SCDLUD_001852 [Saccharomycodes ludwigii]SSD60390.1 related to 21S rRNA pseudouridine(2819) synthase [Saccharomycodes ludwigii]